MNATRKAVVGVNMAKSVFQIYTVEQETGEVINEPFKRTQFLQWFANRASCLVGMEACGGSQHWARQVPKLGHEVKLMSGKMVKGFVCGNKNDATDARAIYMAAKQPEVRSVAVKTQGQQAVLAMHRIRQQLVKVQHRSTSCAAYLVSTVEVFGLGRKAVDTGIKGSLRGLAERLPGPLIDTLRDQWNELARLDERIARIEASVLAWMRQERGDKVSCAATLGYV